MSANPYLAWFSGPSSNDNSHDTQQDDVSSSVANETHVQREEDDEDEDEATQDPRRPVASSSSSSSISVSICKDAMARNFHQPWFCPIAMDENGNIPVGNRFSVTPLILAAEHGRVEIISWLLEQTPDPSMSSVLNHTDVSGRNALMAAVQAGSAQIVRTLLTAGSFVNMALFSNGMTALMIAVSRVPLDALVPHESLVIVELLLHAGASLDGRDEDGRTVLEHAIFSGNMSLVRLLLDHGCPPLRFDSVVDVPLAIARTAQVIPQAIMGGEPLLFPPNIHSGKNLATAEGDDCQELSQMFQVEFKASREEAASVRLQHAMLLRQAAEDGDKHKVALHLNHVGCHASLDRFGHSALQLAAYHGHAEVVRLLLDAGSDVSRANCHGTDVLSMVACRGFLDVLRQLLEAGADVDATDDQQQTALLKAVSRNQHGSVRVLVRAGSSLDAVDKDGDSTLSTATLNGFDSMIDTLMEVGRERGFPQSHRALHSKALLIAANRGSLDLTRKLIACNLDVDVQDSDGDTPLLLAALNGHLSVLQQLCAAGGNVCMQDGNGFTALHGAAIHGHIFCIDFLHMQGADLDAVNKQGESALFWGAYKSQDVVTAHLIAHGANIWLKNSAGVNAFWFSQRNRSIGMAISDGLLARQHRLSLVTTSISRHTPLHQELMMLILQYLSHGVGSSARFPGTSEDDSEEGVFKAVHLEPLVEAQRYAVKDGID